MRRLYAAATFYCLLEICEVTYQVAAPSGEWGLLVSSPIHLLRYKNTKFKLMLHVVHLSVCWVVSLSLSGEWGLLVSSSIHTLVKI